MDHLLSIFLMRTSTDQARTYAELFCICQCKVSIVQRKVERLEEGSERWELVSSFSHQASNFRKVDIRPPKADEMPGPKVKSEFYNTRIKIVLAVNYWLVI